MMPAHLSINSLPINLMETVMLCVVLTALATLAIPAACVMAALIFFPDKWWRM